jgi:hypothetical protein
VIRTFQRLNTRGEPSLLSTCDATGP